MKLLIGTTNKDKYKEMKYVLHTLPFDIISLADLDEQYEEPVEDADTLEGNALIKAKYYAQKTGYVTLADDSGLFVDALDGFPGVKSARTGNNADERMDAVLKKLEGVPMEKRTASFKVTLAVYDPKKDEAFLAYAETKGHMLEEKQPANNGFGYDPIFLVNEFQKTYDQMTMQEKNAASHRGKALSKTKYYLANQYRPKHAVVTCAVIIDRDTKKILLAKRNDPHNPHFHEKWEFSGGGMEMGESLSGNLIREIQEECGYTVNIEKRLHEIGVFDFHNEEKNYSYQVYLIPHLCTIASGDGIPNDEEVLELQWFTLDEIKQLDLIGENKIMFDRMRGEIEKEL